MGIISVVVASKPPISSAGPATTITSSGATTAVACPALSRPIQPPIPSSHAACPTRSRAQETAGAQNNHPAAQASNTIAASGNNDAASTRGFRQQPAARQKESSSSPMGIRAYSGLR